MLRGLPLLMLATSIWAAPLDAHANWRFRLRCFAQNVVAQVRDPVQAAALEQQSALLRWAAEQPNRNLTDLSNRLYDHFSLHPESGQWASTQPSARASQLGFTDQSNTGAGRGLHAFMAGHLFVGAGRNKNWLSGIMVPRQMTGEPSGLRKHYKVYVSISPEDMAAHARELVEIASEEFAVSVKFNLKDDAFARGDRCVAHFPTARSAAQYARRVRALLNSKAIPGDPISLAMPVGIPGDGIAISVDPGQGQSGRQAISEVVARALLSLPPGEQSVDRFREALLKEGVDPDTWLPTSESREIRLALQARPSSPWNVADVTETVREYLDLLELNSLGERAIRFTDAATKQVTEAKAQIRGVEESQGRVCIRVRLDGESVDRLIPWDTIDLRTGPEVLRYQATLYESYLRRAIEDAYELLSFNTPTEEIQSGIWLLEGHIARAEGSLSATLIANEIQYAKETLERLRKKMHSR